jgi:hypothetical protein
MDHYDASVEFELVLRVFEWFFTLVFTLESIVKCVCMKGFLNYWRFPANKFDFLIVVSSWLNVMAESIGLNFAFLKVLRIFRAFRCLRITRVLRKIPAVIQIVEAVCDSVKPIVNIM